MKTKQKEKTNLTTPDLVVLALCHERPMHGYEITQELTRRNSPDWVTVSQSQVYYSVEKLAKAKLILPTASEGSLGPERQTYKTAAKGIERLKDSLNDPSKWSRQRIPTPFETWMGLADILPKSEQLKMIDERKKFVEEQIEKEKADLNQVRGSSNCTYLGEQAIQLSIRQYEVERDWLIEVESLIAAKNS